LASIVGKLGEKCIQQVRASLEAMKNAAAGLFFFGVTKYRHSACGQEQDSVGDKRSRQNAS
jgi:hypothetical protein